ncbi:extracellular solute-binding protein [Pontibacillus salicampi]|uniref:Extracellular solute-binding protein n=1 Tax=Pontibacillus salicampi TaxID=1449801 RepID=A0ABV6LQN9_9BACI
MKKRLGFLFVFLVFGLVMAACSSDDATSSNTEDIGGEITVWAHPFTGEGDEEKEMWNDVISNFEEEHDVTVNFEQIPWSNRDQKILTALASGDGPDVFYAIPDQMPQYADEGLLLELDPYTEDLDMDDFVDTSLVSTTWQDTLYGLPILQEAYTLFYNNDILKEIGADPENLPETWSDFEEWAKMAKENNVYALSYPGGGSMNGTFYPWLWQNGGKVVTQDGEVKINNEAGVETFQFINKMYENGWIPEDSITAQEHNSLWNGGKIMAILGSGITLSNLKAKGEIDFSIGPPLKKSEQVTYGTTGMFVASKKSDNPATAAEFIKAITNTENQKKFNTVTQYIPTRESAKGIFDDQEHLKQLSTYTQYALPGVIHPQGRAIMPLLQAEVQTMMEGKKSPEEAADAAAKAMEQKLKE